MSSMQLEEPPALELFHHLARSRELLATSPLIPSLELALAPLSQAAEILSTGTSSNGDLSLTAEERERLAMELAGVRQLLEGLGQWLSSRGALTPTYNCHADLDVLRWGNAPLGGVPEVSGGALSGVSGRGNLSVEG